ncbi:MAG: xylan 1,4-beta-xylosidase [Lachnospiraceae bacterium]|nr:xylan 1,4-beta-xylosidase [Lachnospiraceae bacterium]
MQKDLRNPMKVEFNNRVDYCVGTGRMGLALQKEYMEQLKLVQKEIGFSHIRGHGLFSDDMAIYQEYEDRKTGERIIEYNFTYLDLVMDNYREVGLKPFLELGFMPKKMASGEQTIFYWRGNVTPPKDYSLWCDLVVATLKHLMDRYGKEEVLTWPIEVWNEPNLPGVWKGADMQEYFRLFEETFRAIKALDPAFRVGGPAICGVKDEFWIEEFMKFIREKKLAVDFITRHHYTTGQHDFNGHYTYAPLEDQEFRFNNLHSTRTIVDSFEEYKGLPIHITEFNTSYTPNCVIHDTNLNAAYLAQHLSRLGDDNESYSYWTFGDIFEEMGVPYTPFHGGFGMVANRSIPKPTFHTFSFYKKLQGECIWRDNDMIAVKNEDGSIRIVAWNVCEKEEERKDKEISVTLPLAEGEYSVVKQLVDEESCNPRKIWHDLGEPSSLSDEQAELLRRAALPFISSERIKAGCDLTLTLKPNAVIYLEVRPSVMTSDRGFRFDH